MTSLPAAPPAAAPGAPAHADAPPSRWRRARWLVPAAWTLYAAVKAALWWVTAAPDDPPLVPVWLAAAEALVWLAITPLVARMTRLAGRVPIGQVLAGHVLLAVAAATATAAARRFAASIAYGMPTPGTLLGSTIFWLDVSVLTYLAVVAITRAVDMHRRYRERATRTHQLETQLARAQLHVLELQLQPHFLFNSLNSVSELAYEDPDDAEKMLRQLHALLRLSTERVGREEVTLEEELAALEPYVEIQRTRFSDWLTVERRVDPEALGALVPHLILQPLVENAIRHGLAVRAGPGRVEVGAQVAGDRLRLRVADDGVGLARAAAAAQRGRGIGVRNARDRLRQLYEPDFRFELVDRAGGGTVVELEIPLRRPETLPGDETFDFATGEHQVPAQSLTVRAGATGTTGTHHVPMLANGAAAAAAAPPLIDPGSEVAGPPPVPPVVARPVRGSPLRSPRTWAGLLLFWAATAVFWTQQRFFLDRARGTSLEGTGLQILGVEATSAAIWALLTPAVLLLARALRITRRNWRSRVLAHGALSLGTAWAHLTLVEVTGLVAPRELFSALNLNPLTGDLFIYFALVAWSHGRDFYAWYQEREVAGARIENEIASARHRALCVQLSPRFLLGTIDLLSRLVHQDVPRAERLIARLADVLRLTLDGASVSEAPLRREIELLRAYCDAYREGIRRGVHLVVDVPSSMLDVPLPVGLLRAIGDELLDGSGEAWGREVELRVEALRLAAGGRLRVRATMLGAADAPRSAPHARVPGRLREEAAALAAAGGVTLLFPDPLSAVVVLGDEPGAEQPANTGELSAAVLSA